MLMGRVSAHTGEDKKRPLTGNLLVEKLAEGNHVRLLRVASLVRSLQRLRHHQANARSTHILDCSGRNAIVDRGKEHGAVELFHIDLLPALAKRRLQRQHHRGIESPLFALVQLRHAWQDKVGSPTARDGLLLEANASIHVTKKRGQPSSASKDRPASSVTDCSSSCRVLAKIQLQAWRQFPTEPSQFHWEVHS